jgi:hypothetical protein
MAAVLLRLKCDSCNKTLQQPNALFQLAQVPAANAFACKEVPRHTQCVAG